MKKDEGNTKEKKLEAVYRAYANDIYRVCLYYLRDEDKAADITQQVFLNYYKYSDEEKQEGVFGRLVYDARKLICSEQRRNSTNE